ncbi:MAG: hypothetical protein ACRDKH_08015 [Solirubrobacterales bacterium]
MGSNTKRFAVLALMAAGMCTVLATSASADPVAEAAKTPKAKTSLSLVSNPFVLPASNPDEAEASAQCPKNRTLLSGGALSNTPVPVGPPPPILDTEIYRSGPDGNGWIVRYDNDADVNLQPSVQAICLKDELKVKGTPGKPKAISKVTEMSTSFALPADTAPTNGVAQLDVACPEGTKVAGGGASFGVIGDVRLQESGPQGNGWHVRYDNDEPVAVTALASALCLKSKLKVKKLPGKDKARSKFEQVDRGVTLPPAATNSGRARFTVGCPDGTTVVGGGGKIGSAIPLPDNNFQLEESGAVGNAWQVTFENDEAVAQSATVHALCLKNKLKVK